MRAPVILAAATLWGLQSLAWVLLPAGSVGARPLAQEEVPSPLRDWLPWVLQGEAEYGCPRLYNAATARCAWPGILQLAVAPEGGRFSQQWDVYAHEPVWIPLPGDRERWPLEVQVDGEQVAVASRAGAPVLALGAGRHAVSGVFTWDALPESLGLPPDLGLLRLTRDGQPAAQPALRPDGRLWLAGEGGAETLQLPAERVDLRIFRRIVDAVPVELVTRLDLDVSGRQRELVVGPVLLADAIPLALDSALPARLEPDGKLRLQVRPGRWQLRVVMRWPGPVEALALPPRPPPWPKEEVWVYEAHPEVRLAEVGGVPAIDPHQTTLPRDWQALPAYRVKAGERLTLKTLRRGDSEPNPDRLQLRRTLWLDFAGGGYSLRDRITGTISRSWRLEAGPALRLGQVQLDGKPQVITAGPSGAGVEIRHGVLDLVADSRYESSIGRLPVTGWRHDFHSVDTTLELPPGWRLLYAGGVDNAPASWLQRWTLLDIFLVLITAVAVQRLWGWGWGALVLAMLTLSWQEPGAPQTIWLALVAIAALLRVVPAGRLQRAVRWLGHVSLVVLLISAIPFLVWEMRTALYPQLEQRGMPVVLAARGEQAPVARLSAAPRAPLAKGKALPSGGVPAKRPESGGYSRFSDQIDAAAVVPVGPGLPDWRWSEFRLRWGGPVEVGQELRLVLLPPLLNRLLNGLRTVLVLLVLVRIIGRPVGRWPLPGGLYSPLLVLLTLGAAPLTSIPTAQAAELPPQDLLDALKARLLAPPDCLPSCAQVPRMQLEVRDQVLTLRLRVEAQERTAVPIPAQTGQWLPTSVLIDEQPATGVFRTPAGGLWVGVPQGVHELLASGPVPSRPSLQLPLPLRPARVLLAAAGWTVQGVDEHGVPQGSLQLTRLAQEAPLVALEPTALPGLVRVERMLRLGVDWSVETRVKRLSPAGSALALAVPLLPGESVVSEGVDVQDATVQVVLSPTAASMRWRSKLAKGERLTLKAPDSTQWVERWTLDVSPMWHVASSGIAPAHHTDPDSNWLPSWRPWPGESVVLEISRPKGIGGRTVALDSSVLDLRPGKHSTDASLKLQIRSTQGGRHVVTLPPGAQLAGVDIDGRRQPIRLEQGKVVLPIEPRTQSLALSWRQPEGMLSLWQAPQVDLGAPSVNARMLVHLGEDRWVLLLGGPRLGPAVLYWGVLGVIVLIALGLGRLKSPPLRAWHWALLGVGLSQADVVAALIVVGWLLLLGWRSSLSPERLPQRWRFDLLQVLLVLATLAALVSVVQAVEQGLLGTPEMQIAGNGSSSNLLQWYQDRTTGLYPGAYVVSLSIWVYKLLMLAWALWLSFALLRWLRWAWHCLSRDGLWQPWRRPRERAKSAEPASEGG